MNIEYYSSILPVIIASGISIVFSYLYQKIKSGLGKIGKLLSYFVIIIPYMLVVGFRGAYVGADTRTYINMFYYYEKIDYGEKLFGYLLKATNYLGKGNFYSILFLVYAFLTLYILVLSVDFFSKKDNNLCYFLFLYYCFFGANMMDQMRQLAAMSFALLVLILYSEMKYKGALLVGLISIGMHASVVILFISIIVIEMGKLYKKVLLKFDSRKVLIRYRLVILITICLITLLFAYEIVVPILANIVSDSYKQYFTTRLNVQSIGLGAIFDIIPVIFLIIFYRNTIKCKNDEVLFCLSAMAIPFRFIGFLSFFVARMAYYPVLTAIYLLSDKNRSDNYRYVLSILAVLYFIIYYVFLNLHAIFPYYSIFYNI